MPRLSVAGCGNLVDRYRCSHRTIVPDPSRVGVVVPYASVRMRMPVDHVAVLFAVDRVHAGEAVPVRNASFIAVAGLYIHVGVYPGRRTGRTRGALPVTVEDPLLRAVVPLEDIQMLSVCADPDEIIRAASSDLARLVKLIDKIRGRQVRIVRRSYVVALRIADTSIVGIEEAPVIPELILASAESRSHDRSSRIECPCYARSCVRCKSGA